MKRSPAVSVALCRSRWASRRTSIVRGQRGVGLIEVLVALLVLSVGVLAIIGMQISGKQANYDAVQRTPSAARRSMLGVGMSVLP